MIIIKDNDIKNLYDSILGDRFRKNFIEEKNSLSKRILIKISYVINSMKYESYKK